MSARTNILEHVFRPQQGDLTRELAEYFLTLDFPSDDHRRYAELAAKAQDGALTSEEQVELDEFLDVNAFLSVVQSKARASLSRNRRV